MARAYGTWPWIHGQCDVCRPGTVHSRDWIIQCTRCLRGHCQFHTVDGCATCGYPYCPQCYRNHSCQRDALLRVHPELQCRFCSRPQDTGNGLSRCARCMESACVGSDLCPSQIVTSHCQCHADLCAECASWRIVARTTRRRMCECHLPTMVQRYICNRCWLLHWNLV